MAASTEQIARNSPKIQYLALFLVDARSDYRKMGTINQPSVFTASNHFPEIKSPRRIRTQVDLAILKGEVA